MSSPEATAKPDVRVRDGVPADAATLAELGARVFRDTYLADNEPAHVEAHIAVTYRPDQQAAELADPRRHYLVAEVGGEPIGFALLHDDHREPGVPGERPVALAQLYVDRALQGRGVGAALMGRCLEDARSRGHDVMGLTVWEHNPRAIAFYGRWGFDVVGEVEFVLGDEPQHDVVMARRL